MSIERHRDRELRAAGDTQAERHKLSSRRAQWVNRDLVQSETTFILRKINEGSPPISCQGQAEAIVRLRRAWLVVQAPLHVFERHTLRYPLQPKPDHLSSKVYHGDKLGILSAYQARNL